MLFTPSYVRRFIVPQTACFSGTPEFVRRGYFKPVPRGTELVAGSRRHSKLVLTPLLNERASISVVGIKPRFLRFAQRLADRHDVCATVISGDRRLLQLSAHTPGVALETVPTLSLWLEGNCRDIVLAAVPPDAWISAFEVAMTECGRRWTMTMYSRENAGLVIAGTALARASDLTEVPRWFGDEVTTRPSFTEPMLLRFPYRRWPRESLDAVRFGHNPFTSRP